MGLIENIDDSTLLANQQAQAANNFGIAGAFNRNGNAWPALATAMRSMAFWLREAQSDAPSALVTNTLNRQKQLMGPGRNVPVTRMDFILPLMANAGGVSST